MKNGEPEMRRARRIWDVIRWPVILLLLCWFALALNAWRYFSASGWSGVYFSAVHAVDVLLLPESRDIPSTPDHLEKLTSDELNTLIDQLVRERRAFLFENRRFEDEGGSSIFETFVFAGPNTYTFASNFGVAFEHRRGRFVRDDDRICTVGPRAVDRRCHQLFEDESGNLFRFLPFPRSRSNKWQRIEISRGK